MHRQSLYKNATSNGFQTVAALPFATYRSFRPSEDGPISSLMVQHFQSGGLALPSSTESLRGPGSTALFPWALRPAHCVHCSHCGFLGKKNSPLSCSPWPAPSFLSRHPQLDHLCLSGVNIPSPIPSWNISVTLLTPAPLPLHASQ